MLSVKSRYIYIFFLFLEKKKGNLVFVHNRDSGNKETKLISNKGHVPANYKKKGGGMCCLCYHGNA